MTESLHWVENSATGTAAGISAAHGQSYFSKRFNAEWLFRATLRNSLRAWSAARRSRWLRVPEVLRADHRELRIDYELMAGWRPLHTILRHRSFAGIEPVELQRMFWTVGAALEELHRHTHRIHGDFDFDNVLVKRGAEQVVFVDFTPPAYASFARYNEASPYRDIAMLVLFVRAKYPPQQLHLALRPQLTATARAFVRGYFHRSPAEFDRRQLDSSMNELLRDTYLGATFTARWLRHSRLYRTDDLAPQSAT